MIYKQYDYAECGDDMQARWSQHWAGRTGWVEDHTKEALWPTIEDVVTRPGRLLEAGCGTGKWVHYFGKMSHHAIGVDYATASIHVALQSDPDLRVLRCDCRALPFADNSFDYVFANGTVEHDIAGPHAALREFLRVLRPGGRLMSSVPCLNMERRALYPWLVTRDWLKRRALLRRVAHKTNPYVFYQYVFSPTAYAIALKNCGFEVQHLRPYGEQNDVRLVSLMRPVLRRMGPFYCPHMVMGICRKPD